MKNFQKIYLTTLLFGLLFSSCEKGIETVEQDSTVYLLQSGLTTQTALLGESVFNLGVYHAGINQANESVTVALSVDEAAGATFIAQNAGYEMLPSTYYTIPKTSVEIGKGEERAMYQIQLKNIDETFTGKKYILPVSIQSTEEEVTISETNKLAVLQFARFRNVYEAKYKAYGMSVLAGTTDTDKLKIDEAITSTSVDANTIQVKGAVSGLNLLLKVQGGQVQISGATGSEAFNVANTAGKSSTYVGEFSEVHQCNTGTYTLFYTYTASGKQMDASVELKFWL